ncbi:MAG: GNAT family N-acetyltransferase [Pseudomonadota bacterium]
MTKTQTVAPGTSGKIALRRFSEADASRIADLANDVAVTRFTSRMPYPYALSDAQAFLADIAARSEPGADEAFAITLDGLLAGCIAYEPARLGDQVPADALEIGYWLGRPYWGKGIATAAVRQLLVYLEETVPGWPIAAGVFETNPASMRVLQKTGFVEIGCGTCVTPARDVDSVPARLFLFQHKV